MSVSGDDSPGRVEQAIILISWLPGTSRSEAELTGGWGAGPDAPSSPRIHIPSLPPGSLVCPLTLLNDPQRSGELSGGRCATSEALYFSWLQGRCSLPSSHALGTGSWSKEQEREPWDAAREASIATRPSGALDRALPQGGGPEAGLPSQLCRGQPSNSGKLGILSEPQNPLPWARESTRMLTAALLRSMGGPLVDSHLLSL